MSVTMLVQAAQVPQHTITVGRYSVNMIWCVILVKEGATLIHEASLIDADSV